MGLDSGDAGFPIGKWGTRLSRPPLLLRHFRVHRILREIDLIWYIRAFLS